MKYLKALSIVALSAAFILTGCGKDTEEVQPVVEPIIQSQPAKEETTQEESVEEETTRRGCSPGRRNGPQSSYQRMDQW